MRNLWSVALVFAALFNYPSGVYAGKSDLKGKVKIDGSSTVLPITEAVAEEFTKEHPRVQVTVGKSGTGGGFKKFYHSEIDINDASRSIKKEEAELAKKNGVEYLELPVAYDGITVVVNPSATWVDHLTVAELKKIWQPGSKVKRWSDVRAGWPNEPLRLYGPGTDSGTFDYFTEAINGKSHVSRDDFNKSEDDNMLVTGVAGDKFGLGFFGFAYFDENRKKLKAVPIDNGKGPVAPSTATIADNTYAPLSRPIFIYVSRKSGQRDEVSQFIRFYLKTAGELAKEAGYIPLPDVKYKASTEAFDKFIK